MSTEYVVSNEVGILAVSVDKDRAIRQAREIEPEGTLFCTEIVDGVEKGGSFVGKVPF